jgi:hypothetical protein
VQFIIDVVPVIRGGPLLFVTPRYSTLLYATLRHSTLRYVTLRYATLRYATLRYATLRYATLRYATLRYTLLLYATLRLRRGWMNFHIIISLLSIYHFPTSLAWHLARLCNILKAGQKKIVNFV